MFEMEPEMDFGERLSLWWSCFWRQFLIAIVFAVIIVICVLLLGQPWKWHEMAREHQMMPVMVELGVLFVGLVICMIPLNGDMVRRGFVAQQLTAPSQFELGRGFMLGLTTAGWTMVAGIPAAAISAMLLRAGHPLGSNVLNFVVQALATMYIVLPRQARRLRLQAGYDE